MNEDKVVTVQENNTNTQVPNSPIAAYQMLLNNGGSLENIEKMMDLQAKWDGIEAKKKYVKAMVLFKAHPIKIDKDKKVIFKTQKGVTSYDHASLGNVTSKINSELAKHDLSAGWKTDQGQSGITVTCTITHTLGHSESTSLTAGAETSGTKNSIQAIGSTITYLQRYTLLALTGLATHDQDDDGGRASAPVEYLTTDQAIDINDRLTDTKSDVAKFLLNFNAPAVEEIQKAQYGRALNMLKAKAGVL